jgi:DNA-directed RNA polymerase subunit H (RpoH/RPB5)
VTHENASTYPGKELLSENKKRLQIRAVELEKTVFPQIQNYDTVEAILNDVIKILEMKKIADLHLMRKLKFVPTLIDMCKRISCCARNELKHLGKTLGSVIKIIQ